MTGFIGRSSRPKKGTSGDIVVYITHRDIKDPLAAANREFSKLRLETPTKTNSFLIFLAPKSQKFAVVGGTALHDAVGQSWWDHLSALLTRHFKEGQYTEGLVAAIGARRACPANSFPRERGRSQRGKAISSRSSCVGTQQYSLKADQNDLREVRNGTNPRLDLAMKSRSDLSRYGSISFQIYPANDDSPQPESELFFRPYMKPKFVPAR